MSPFPRPAYAPLSRYDPGRTPVEIELSDNTSGWGPHPAALRLLRGMEPDLLRRYPTVYGAPLAEAVANRFGVPVDSVVTGGGSDHLLDAIHRASGEPGERVNVPVPTFSMAEIFPRMNGMVPHPIPTAPGSDPDPRALLEGNPALLYLCRPNNPTGALLPRAWMEELLDLVGDSGPLVLLDEAYADFAGESFLSEAATSPRLVVVRTLSKSYGLAGLRVGFAVAHPLVAREIEKSRGPYGLAHPAEEAAAAAIEDREGWIPTVLEETRRNREALRTALREGGADPYPSAANFLLVPVRDPRRSAEALRRRGVGVRPFADLPGFGPGLRVSIGPREVMERFLGIWNAAVAAGEIVPAPRRGGLR